MIKSPAKTRKRRRDATPAEALLAWYDANRRELPWRAAPGRRADPYAVWLSEIMLQQTTVATVKSYFETFLARWPTVEALAEAPLDDVLAAWAGLGYYARARNLHACAGKVARERDGRFPESEAQLLTLPGVGPYTAAAVAAIAFDIPCAAVDGNVERVMARLHAIETPARQAKTLLKEKAQALVPAARAGDFAQALMDLGATVCTPRGPRCELCPWAEDCAAFRAGVPQAYPVKERKPEKPRRRGAIFILRRGEEILLARRPQKGLFGGMNVFPSTPLSRDVASEEWLDFAPCRADWRALCQPVSHAFTHFALTAAVFVADAKRAPALDSDCRWAAQRNLDKEGLPALMRKAAAAVGLLDGEQGRDAWRGRRSGSK